MFISKLEKNTNLLKGAMLFQSVAQFISYLSYFSFGIAIIYATDMILNTNFINYKILFGAFMGSLFPLYLVRPVKFSVYDSDLVRVKAYCDGALHRMGYTCVKEGSEDFRYLSRLPKILRWKENHVLIKNGKNVVVSGARLPVKRIWDVLWSSSYEI